MNFSTRLNRFRIAILRMMSSEPLHRDTGETLSEVIARHPIELAYDAHALMHIVPVGRVCFGLKGDALSDYVSPLCPRDARIGRRPCHARCGQWL